MPIYEYRCSSCSERFEALQRVSDAPLDTCRLCGGPVRRMISAPAIQFVGSGWYVTDYARREKGKEGASRRAHENGEARSADSASKKKSPAPGSDKAKGASAKGGAEAGPAS